MASIRWVRPALTTSAFSSALAGEDAGRWSRAGSRSWVVATAAATWMAEGNTSFDDCEALTWSLGWTGAVAQPLAGQRRR